MIRNSTAHSRSKPAASTRYSRFVFAWMPAAIGAHGTYNSNDPTCSSPNSHRHVHLEELAELALRHVLLLGEIAHLGRQLAVEAFLQIVVDRERLADQLVLVGVEHLARGGPELDPRELPVGQTRLERVVEGLHGARWQAVLHVAPIDVRLESDLDEELCGGCRVVCRIRPVVHGFDLGEGESEHGDRCAAEQRERADEPQPGRAEPRHTSRGIARHPGSLKLGNAKGRGPKAPAPSYCSAVSGRSRARDREGPQAFSNTSTDSGSSPQSNVACATTLLPGMLIASSRPSATIGSDRRQ